MLRLCFIPTARLSYALPLLGLALLAGCAAGPDYVRPDLSLPQRYTARPLAGEAAPAAGAVRTQALSPTLDIPAQWWQAFRSDSLNTWVQASLAHNPNVDAAQAALRAAQESAEAERAAFWPSATLNYSPTRQRVASVLASPLASNVNTYNLHTAQLSVSYAPDVFGGTRRAVEAAQAQTEQQRFQLEATYLTLSANVVTAAINEAALRAQRKATLAIIAEQKDVLRGYRAQQALGQLALADVDAQAAALATTEATLPPLDKQLAQQRNQLATLAGRYPADDDAGVHFDLDAFELPAALPLSLPSHLVEHRPDVRAAEAQLQAASAGIGVAVAARLPSLQLGVNAGSSAAVLSQLFTSPAAFWTLAAGVTQPLFDGGALKHREAAARANFDQAAAQYRATVLGAFQDVANALDAIDADTRALRTAIDAERANARSLARARAQLQLGDASPLAVRAAEQAWQQSLLSLAQARAARLTDTAALFQALGGGWWNRPDAVAQATAAH